MNRPCLTRRGFLCAAGAGLLSASPVSAAEPRIVSLDYGLASTLLSLGVTPVGIAAAADWAKWVVSPPLPSDVADVGDAMTVNLEALTALAPDLILTTPYLDSLTPKLETIAPCLRLSIYDPSGGDVLAKAEQATMALGEAIGRKREAQIFLDRSAASLSACRDRIARKGPSSVLLISFLDARHARVYCAPGLFDSTLHRIGITNAWPRAGQYWGFETIGIEQLAEARDEATHLIVFEPVPREALATIAESPIWQSLPFVRNGRFAILPETLMFGMVNEAVRFAGQMADYMEGLS